MPEGEQSTHMKVNAPVFFSSAGLLVLLVLFGVFFTDAAAALFSTTLDFVATRFGWFYMLAMTFMVGFCVWLLFSRHARLRLGPDDARPDYSRATWFAMLFSAGMGIGLLFYGVAEPIQQYVSPPMGNGATLAAAKDALPITFFHWGIHAWAVYAVMGLAITYFAYRHGQPLAIRSVLYPLLGERIKGRAGDAVDILAVFGTLFGLATSLGLGSMQISTGLDHLKLLQDSPSSQLTLIAVITAIATISLVSGVDRGIRRLSELNMLLAATLMVFVFFVGPTQLLIDAFVQNIGFYLRDFIARSFWMNAFGHGEWHKSWTLFYWGWWIAWSPFVGVFVARISRGRTIREFLLGVLLVPTALTFLWMTIFGNTAIALERGGAGIATAVNNNVATAIYVMLEQLPMSGITSFLAASVVAVFFVTSSDSASFVVDMITSGGHPNPPTWQRVFWAVAEGSVAAVLLTASGKRGLKALQAAVVSVGLPFAAILVLICFSLVVALRAEPAR